MIPIWEAWEAALKLHFNEVGEVGLAISVEGFLLDGTGQTCQVLLVSEEVYIVNHVVCPVLHQ